MRRAAPAELQRLEGRRLGDWLGENDDGLRDLANCSYLLNWWENISGVVQVRAQLSLASQLPAWADARRARPAFFIYFCHLKCRDYGKAKIWVGETSVALVFILLSFSRVFFYSFPLFNFYFRARAIPAARPREASVIGRTYEQSGMQMRAIENNSLSEQRQIESDLTVTRVAARTKIIRARGA